GCHCVEAYPPGGVSCVWGVLCTHTAGAGVAGANLSYGEGQFSLTLPPFGSLITCNEGRPSDRATARARWSEAGSGKWARNQKEEPDKPLFPERFFTLNGPDSSFSLVQCGVRFVRFQVPSSARAAAIPAPRLPAAA